MAEGSELDLELKRELKGSVELSRTDLKKESDRRQALGEALKRYIVDPQITLRVQAYRDRYGV